METKLRGVLLDLDGTLANTEDYQYLYAQNKPLEEILEFKLYNYLSPILKTIPWGEFIDYYIRAQKEVKGELKGTAASHSRYLYIQKTLELCGVSFIPGIIQRGYDYYFDEMLRKTVLYPGVLDVLKVFKYNRLKTCMVTDFTADVQLRKVRKLGIMRYIDYLVTSEEAGADKPHPEQALLALRKLHLQQEEVVIIGNNPKTDIALAEGIKMKSILFDPRKLYQDKEGKETFYTQNFTEVPKLLKLETKKFSRKKLLVLDFVGTLTNEKDMIEEVLCTFIHKDPAYVAAEYQLFRRGLLEEAAFWYKMGIGDMKKAYRAIDASITIKKSVVSLLKRLQEEYTLVLLTDFPRHWGKQIIENRGLGKLFNQVIFGGDTKFSKPDPDLYLYLLGLYPEVNPENVTLVDDTPAALATGRDFLMTTILISNQKATYSVFVPDHMTNDVLHIESLLNKGERLIDMR
ncbi:HAD family hydrolase [bacterium]|nr:HAD family hydrolase [bacterium]